MRIAQISPLFESVPPAVYGGTERVVSYLTEELVRAGHDVTLFASGDSRTAARLVPMVDRSLRLDPDSIDQLAHHILMIERIRQVADSFDILHFHIDYLHYPVSRYLAVPQLTTLHGRLNLKDLVPLYDEFTDMPVVSISNSQRTPLPQANWIGNVHHGLPEDLLVPDLDPPGDYLVFIGRISPEKRVDRAVEIARRAGLPLRVAAKISQADEAYFHDQIAPLFEEPFVHYLGEVDDAEKNQLLAGARALLFPIDWPEPFGLVMIEAMACGTPTIAWGEGSVSEILEDNLTGFIVKSVEEAATAVERAQTLSRADIRGEFERRFTARRMARDYLSIYQRVLSQRSGRRPAHHLHHD